MASKKNTLKSKFSLGNIMINLLIISVLLFFGLAILVPHFYPRIIARNKTTAEVVEVVVENRTFIPKSGDSHETDYYYPVIRYMANGESITANYNIDATYNKRHNVGDSITIFYNNKNPKQNYSVEERNGKQHVLVLAFGIFTTLIAILFIYSFITMSIIPYIKSKTTNVDVYSNVEQEQNTESNEEINYGLNLKLIKLKTSTFIAILLIPLLLLTLGSAIIISHFKMRMLARTETTAEVVSIVMQEDTETYKDSSDNTRTRDIVYHYPVIVYTANEESITVQHNSGQGHTSRFKVGEIVTIYYNADNPKQYYIKGYYKGISPFLVLGIFLVFFMVPLIIHMIKEFIKSQ